MTRIALLGLAVLVACGKKHDAPPQAAEPAVTTAPPATAPVAPAQDPAKEAARTSGLLGPTDQGSFEDLPAEGGSAAAAAESSRRAGDTGAAPRQGSHNADSKVDQTLAPPKVAAKPAASIAVLTKVTVDGADRPAVTALIEDRLPALAACRDAAAAKRAGSRDTVTLGFSIKPDGHLENVVVLGRAASTKDFDRCIVDAVKSAVLANPSSKTAVRATFEIQLRAP